MEQQQQNDTAHEAARDANFLVARYAADGASALRIHAAAYLFTLGRIYGTDEAVHALQQISRHFVSRERQKIRLAVDNGAA